MPPKDQGSPSRFDVDELHTIAERHGKSSEFEGRRLESGVRMCHYQAKCNRKSRLPSPQCGRMGDPWQRQGFASSLCLAVASAGC